jgi:bifunctional UDP-N-acetylglucosamine pyrophosphorylase / glucosamine-1-phosphate N-acetyltransferase
MQNKIEALIEKGATIIDERSVSIAKEVDIARLAGKGVTLYPGTRILGAGTFISEGVQIGAEGPVTIENCWVGPKVQLKGGFFSGAVFLNKAVCGSGAHVRQGTILEEEASIAHTVGLKQTILFPYVTLGSLINFCDCLMAGGTSRKNHSEVGSSYIHFNFTPNQDKATPSLMGDVPRGVMLNNAPIFLGGQGGLIGPCRLAYGTVVAAGTICRNDQLEERHLIFGSKNRSGSIPYTPGGLLGLKRIIRNNLIYIGNLTALGRWYRHVRAKFIGSDFPPALHAGLLETIEVCIAERVRQLGRLSAILGQSQNGGQHELVARWNEIQARLLHASASDGSQQLLEGFVSIIERTVGEIGKSYLDVIKALDSEQAAAGILWLEGIVQQVLDSTADILPGVAGRS